MIVASFIIAAVLTPPDVLSQIMLAIPMILLYEGGLLVCRMIRPRTREDADNDNTDRAEDEQPEKLFEIATQLAFCSELVCIGGHPA